MKIIPLYINARKGTLIDSNGSEINVREPIFDIGSQFVLSFKVFSNASEDSAPPILYNLEEEGNYYFAIDHDFDFGTDPLAESYYDDVVIGNQIAETSYSDSEVSILIDTSSIDMINAINQDSTLNAYMCLWYNYQGENSLLLHTSIQLSNITDLGD